MEKVIYKTFEKCTVLNKHNKVIENIISDVYLLNDTDYNKLPSSVLNNPQLYLGAGFNGIEIDLFKFKKLLFNNISIEKDLSYYEVPSIHDYTYYGIEKIIMISKAELYYKLMSFTNIKDSDKHEYSIIVNTLILGLIEKKFNVDAVNVFIRTLTLD